ncbi:HNH endonuclease [Geminocystis sp. CENA526]|uniref:HNH endonuclease n=1 Tax=Geminocystis sp. CENA526 TaxID=1355871 RepID=UPI003D6EAB0E
MSRPYLPLELKKLVAKRANYGCEYCLMAEKYRPSGCHIDHIISLKHGGENSSENLAYACLPCNLNKGTDLGSINPKTGELVRFFNPRRDKWSDHFCINDGRIEPLTDIGEVTVRIFQFNTEDRILERKLLIELNQYPPSR